MYRRINARVEIKGIINVRVEINDGRPRNAVLGSTIVFSTVVRAIDSDGSRFDKRFNVADV